MVSRRSPVPAGSFLSATGELCLDGNARRPLRTDRHGALAESASGAAELTLVEDEEIQPGVGATLGGLLANRLGDGVDRSK